MRKGELSAAKAEAIASAATGCTGAETSCWPVRREKPLAELREECLRAKADDADQTRSRSVVDRFARVYKDAEGAWNLFARGTVG